MKKPVFLKVILVSNSETIVTLSKQKFINKDGNEEEVDPVRQVTIRDTPELEEGMIFATDELKVHPTKGWYVAGRVLYQITDAQGIHLAGSEISDDIHAMYIDEYTAFKTGEVTTNFTEDGKRKPMKVSYLQTIKADKSLAVPTIENDGWYVDPDLWYHLIRNYSKKKNTLLIGDSGAGKTELVRLLMRKIAKPLNIFDMAISNPNKVLCGNLRADNGTTYYQYSRFAESIQKEGGILLDEISRANPTANNILLPVLDGRRTLYIEDAIDEVEIELHQKCAIWATANIGTKFIGTSMLDHALLNRFHQVAVAYPPQEKESLLLQKVWGLSKRNADAVVSVADTIRSHPDLSKDISTRQLIEIAELISDGYNPKEAFEWSVLQQFDSDRGDGGERQTVLSAIQSL